RSALTTSRTRIRRPSPPAAAGSVRTARSWGESAPPAPVTGIPFRESTTRWAATYSPGWRRVSKDKDGRAQTAGFGPPFFWPATCSLAHAPYPVRVTLRGAHQKGAECSTGNRDLVSDRQQRVRAVQFPPLPAFERDAGLSIRAGPDLQDLGFERRARRSGMFGAVESE